MSRRFENQSVLVTGASSGVGEAAARMFASEGARVVLVARTAAALDKVAKDIGERAVAIPTDVADSEQIAALVDRVLHDVGDLHVLVNNAGFNHRGDLEGTESAALAHVIDVNLKAPILLSRAFLPHFLQHPKSAIVNVASIAGQVPLPGEATYSATKFGLRGFSMALAEELHDTNVSVSIVSPGPIDTGFLTNDIDTVPDLVFSQPMSTAEEVAAAILDCAHDGKLERTLPRLSGTLATAGYLFPDLPRYLRPLLDRQGRAAKEKFRRERAKD
jgi:short-subunit dehydrogenase